MDAWRIVSPNGKWDIIIICYSFPKTDMKSLLPFHVNWTNKTDFQLWWTISDVATAGHSMAQIMTTVATAQVWVLTMNFYRCSECKSKCWAQKDKQQTPDRTPTSRWGCWRRWRGWWGPGRRHTAARGGRRPQRSSLSAARAASFLVTGSTPGHWEALRDRWRRAAGHPGTWRSRRGQFNNPFKNSDAGMRFTLQKRPSRVPITALFLSTLSHHREFVWLIRCRRLV